MNTVLYLSDKLLMLMFWCLVVLIIGFLASFVRAAEPPAAWSDDPPVAHTRDMNPLAGSEPTRDTLRASDGKVYEKHPDGIYRLVPGQVQGAPAVAPSPTFRTRDSHACPTCGRLQFTVSGFNANGTHSHRCPVDGTVWSH